MILPKDVTIRPATVSDLDAIVRLWLGMMREHEAFDPRVNLSESAEAAYRQYARYYIQRGDTAVFVAARGDEVIGFGLAYCARNLPMFRPQQYGFVSDLVVEPSWRGRGIGTALLGAIKGWFGRHGIEHVQLQVYSRNAPGLAFWRKSGFTEFVHGLWLDLGQ